jgi:hypothetical protein
LKYGYRVNTAVAGTYVDLVLWLWTFPSGIQMLSQYLLDDS